MRTPTVLVIAAFLAAAIPASGRQVGAYGVLDWSVGGAENMNRVGMHTWWWPSTGVSARVSTNGRVGIVEVGGRWVPMSPRTTAQPAWDALLLYAGWGPRWVPTNRLRLTGTARLGLLRMMFDEETFAGVKTENELSIGFAARVEWFALRNVGVFAEATAERTFTSMPIDWIHGSAGLVLRTRTPVWLRRVLE